MHPFQSRRDALARLLAASLMSLTEDYAGTNLPEDCWRQMIPKANAILFIIASGQEQQNAGRQLERDLDPERGYHGPG